MFLGLFPCPGFASTQALRVLTQGLCSGGPVRSLVSLGEALEVGLRTRGQRCLPAQQLVQDVYFSISSLNVLKRSPGHVVLELIGTEKFVGTGPPFLEEKGEIHIAVQFPFELGCPVPQPNLCPCCIALPPLKQSQLRDHPIFHLKKRFNYPESKTRSSYSAADAGRLGDTRSP